jgi:hypothetical protein
MDNAEGIKEVGIPVTTIALGNHGEFVVCPILARSDPIVKLAQLARQQE